MFPVDRKPPCLFKNVPLSFFLTHCLSLMRNPWNLLFKYKLKKLLFFTKKCNTPHLLHMFGGGA